MLKWIVFVLLLCLVIVVADTMLIIAGANKSDIVGSTMVLALVGGIAAAVTKAVEDI